MTLQKSKTAENASHYELENMQHGRKKRSHWENEAEEKKRGGKTQMEGKGCCCSEQRKHQGNLAAGQFREGSRQKGVGLECTFFQNRGSTHKLEHQSCEMKKKMIETHQANIIDKEPTQCGQLPRHAVHGGGGEATLKKSPPPGDYAVATKRECLLT